MQMIPTTPPRTPRETLCASFLDQPCTPSTCAPSTCDSTPIEMGTPNFTTPTTSKSSGYMQKLTSTPTCPCVPSSILPADLEFDTTPLPQDLDAVQTSLLSFLEFMQTQPQRRPVAARSPPMTPTNSLRRQALETLSPPPAPRKRQFKSALATALEQNDLVTVVEVLAERPVLATVPFFDGEFPVMCALRLGCEPAIISVLCDNGASFRATPWPSHGL